MKNELFVTADGSHSLRSEHFGVSYHSVHGAVQESRHVFLAAGLLPVLEAAPTSVNILEMGLGTGLNVLLTLEEAQQRSATSFAYHAYELYPITTEQSGEFNYSKLVKGSDEFLATVHDSSWGTWQQWLPNFRFRKDQADFIGQQERAYPPASFDIIYYDAFAPASQPELWTPETMKICFDALKPGGVLVTYCAKGQFKRDLKSVGFTVEPLPGPPGKREMTRGRKT